MTQQIGKQSILFANPPYLLESGSVVGTKEGEGPLGDAFDMVGEEDHFEEEKWEQAESMLQKKAFHIALGKAGVDPIQVRYLFAGDLLGQTIATSFGLMEFQIPLFGLYGACSTCGEGLALGAMTVAAGYANLVGAVTSSHFASAEKQFRFPLEYANQRPPSATWTVTGSGAFLICSKEYYVNQTNIFDDNDGKTNVDNDKKYKGYDVVITGITTGMILDYGVKDSMNMGAAMAPAAADCIYQHLLDFERQPEDYDRIITGDLGVVGQEILLELMKQRGMDISKVHADCGIEIYDSELQGTGAGGSGCGCSAVTLSAHFLPMLRQGALKRILFVPTGALLSKISFNEGQTVPGIAHAVVLEAVDVE